MNPESAIIPAVKFAAGGPVKSGPDVRAGLSEAGKAQLERRPENPEQAGRDFVRSLDDEFLYCRYNHDFPKVRRPGKVPKGIRITPAPGGCFQETQVCPDCGTERTKTTLPGGWRDPDAHWSYRHPGGYAAPAGSGLTSADYEAEKNRRNIEAGMYRT